MSSTAKTDDEAPDELVTAAVKRVDLKDPSPASSPDDDDDKPHNNEPVTASVAAAASSSSAAGASASSNDSDKPNESQDDDNDNNNNNTDDNDDDDDEDDDASMSSSSTSSTDDSVINDAAAAAAAAAADILTTEQVNEKLFLATQQKEQGNTHFKKGDLAQAARWYRRGVHTLKPLQVCKKNNNNNKTAANRSGVVHLNDDDPQIKALWMTLQTNLSTVLFKQGKYKHSVQCATQALSVRVVPGTSMNDETNTSSNNNIIIKVLYRRAVAERKLGNLKQAEADLKQALQYDNTNTACKKELVSIQKELEQTKAAQKKALAKAFSNKSGSFLYDDKEAAEQKRLEKDRQDKIQAQELYKQRKQQWEDECVTRMANNEPAISFDEWEKELKEKEEAKRKEEEAKRKEEEKKRKEEERKHRELAKQQRKKAIDGNEVSDSDDDEEELTKEELAMMRGYKKTSDGRTTSYFTRELSEQEKQRIGDIAPRRLDSTTNTSRNNVPTATASSPSSGNGPQRLKSSATREGASAWNAAGTWEERDTTAWCSAQLRKRLEETSVTGDKVDADIVSVEELTGDASFAIAGGKKRYIFDFHVKLKYEIKDPEKNNEVVAKGTVALPDICSTSHDELEVTFQAAWQQKPPRDTEAKALAIRTSLASELRKSVQTWVQDFNNQY